MADCTAFTYKATDGSGSNVNFPALPPLLTPVDINASAGFPLTIFHATAGMFVRIYRINLVADAATIITFKDGAAALPFEIKMAAGEIASADVSIFPWWQGSVNQDFTLNVSVACQLTGAIWGFLNAS